MQVLILVRLVKAKILIKLNFILYTAVTQHCELIVTGRERSVKNLKEKWILDIQYQLMGVSRANLREKKSYVFTLRFRV